MFYSIQGPPGPSGQNGVDGKPGSVVSFMKWLYNEIYIIANVK